MHALFHTSRTGSRRRPANSTEKSEMKGGAKKKKAGTIARACAYLCTATTCPLRSAFTRSGRRARCAGVNFVPPRARSSFTMNGPAVAGEATWTRSATAERTPASSHAGRGGCDAMVVCAATTAETCSTRGRGVVLRRAFPLLYSTIS
jgi:hypothetical protein